MPERKRPGKIIDIQGRLGAASVVDELAGIFAESDRGLSDAEAVLYRGIDTFGKDEVLEELCRRLTRLQPEEDSTSILWALEEIGGRTVVRRLKEIMQKAQFAPRVRTEAAMVLNALGESVDLDVLPAPGPEDLEGLLAETERQLGQVSEGERAFMLNDILEQFTRYAGQAHRHRIFRMLVETLKERKERIAADMVWTIYEFGPEEEIRHDAGQALEAMQERGVAPSPGMVSGTYAGKFSRAYASDMGGADPQGQLFIAWKQGPDRLLVLSFMVDYAFWGGAVKDFFVRHSITEEMLSDILARSRSFGIPMVEITEAEARRRVVEALRSNVDRMRPLPQGYRRYHHLVSRMLFAGAFPVALLSPDEERRSPLPGRAGRVEELLQEIMPGAGYDAEQVRNGRMLWRDYYETHAPNVGKPEVWAAAIDYVIGDLEGRTDQTQQAVAERYSVSSASISKRSRELWDTFVNVEQGAIAYITEKGPPDEVEDLYDLMGDVFDDELTAEEAEEESLRLDYLDYLEYDENEGGGVRRLNFREFTRLTYELDDLMELEEEGELTPAQRRRLRELERLLLLED